MSQEASAVDKPKGIFPDCSRGIVNGLLLVCVFHSVIHTKSTADGGVIIQGNSLSNLEKHGSVSCSQIR